MLAFSLALAWAFRCTVLPGMINDYVYQVGFEKIVIFKGCDYHINQQSGSVTPSQKLTIEPGSLFRTADNAMLTANLYTKSFESHTLPLAFIIFKIRISADATHPTQRNGVSTNNSRII